MDEEARVAKFGDFPCEQLHSLRGVAKDDGLIDLELSVIIVRKFVAVD